MARQKPEDVQKELNQQEDDNYGDETISGTNPRPDADDDVEEFMENVVGNDFDEEEPMDIAEEIEDDEEDIQDKPIDGYEEEEPEVDDEPEGELQRVEKEEGLTSIDPLENVSDDDFREEDDEE